MDTKNFDHETKEAIFDQPTILININRFYKPNMSENTIYEATRQSWVIDADHANKIKVVCAVYQGIIKGVFFADRWFKTADDKRYYFEGVAASDELHNKYIGKSVKKYWPLGSQNPIKYAEYEVNGIKYKS